MNKAALLHMMQHVSALSNQDVEELEKLAKNFPYCQTAHLLIAKASYDKGNMLSNQKLRKAAAYASNRQLLKKLIYTTDASVPLAEITTSDEFESQPETAAIPENLASGTSNIEVKSEEVTPVASYSDLPNESVYAPEDAIEKVENVTAEESTIIAATPLEEAFTNEEEVVEESIAPVQETYILPQVEAESYFTSSEIDELLQVEKWKNSTVPSEPASLPDLYIKANESTPEPALPNPVEAAEIIRYELEAPEEIEEGSLEQTLAHFDSYLFKPERDEYIYGELKPATTEEFIREVYTSNQLGYWMGSSRLGELLQVKDELTHHTPLQFYPDLILEYSKQNYLTPTDPPKAAPVNKQFEIIDQFLKASPKLKTFSVEKVRAEPLDDLAFKSTKNTKNLASENLANIMVQQGKIKKAMKIYEHLIVKIPEKKAYFAAQIEKLRNQI